jgi:hypothetical protein
LTTAGDAALVARHGGFGMGTPVRLADGRAAKVFDLHWGPAGPAGWRT